MIKCYREKNKKRNISVKNQFGFVAGWLTMKAIHILSRFMKKYMKSQINLHMVFTDLGKKKQMIGYPRW